MSDAPRPKSGYLVEAVLRACDLLEVGAFDVGVNASHCFDRFKEGHLASRNRIRLSQYPFANPAVDCVVLFETVRAGSS